MSIGPNLRALVVYLLVFQHVPMERCRQQIADVSGAQVAPPGVYITINGQVFHANEVRKDRAAGRFVPVK